MLGLAGVKKVLLEISCHQGLAANIRLIPKAMQRVHFQDFQHFTISVTCPLASPLSLLLFASLMRDALEVFLNFHHYFYDTVIATETCTEHLGKLRHVFERIYQNSLAIRPTKAEAVESTLFIKHRIGRQCPTAPEDLVQYLRGEAINEQKSCLVLSRLDRVLHEFHSELGCHH